MAGSGSNTCQTNSDCNIYHSECQNGACNRVSGIGVGQCQSNSDCAISKHNECNSQNQCISVDGTGFDQCQTNSECASVYYNECSGGQCIQKSGVGVNQCQTNGDCVIAKHNICNSGKQCVSVSGSGQDGCQADSDCGEILNSHRECSADKQCISVIGAGADLCGTSNDCRTPTPGVTTHSECSPQKQCIVINGPGTNQCQSDAGCNPLPVGVVQSVANAIQQQLPDQVAVATNELAKEAKNIISSPQGSIITKTISTTGFVVATAATSIPFFSLSFVEIFLVPLRLFGILLTAFGLKKRVVPWGVVYDSVTKQPLDPAYIVLKNLQGQEVATAITDLDGRYGFLVPPGVYQISVNKTNYSFPSQKLTGKTHDELHTDLYFGESIDIRSAGEVILKNIPLDPVKFDWNEFAKRNKNLMKFYSKWDVLLRKIYDSFFVIGFIVAIIAYIFAPYPYNTVIVALYVLLLLLRIFGLKPKSYGYITDKTTGIPLSFAIVRVMMPDTDREITSKPADKYGKYYCLVPPGKYYVKIERKNDDGSYSLAYKSTVIDVSKKGIIKERFKV